MKDGHLTLETLALWLAGELDPEVLRQQVLPHFLSRCPECTVVYEEVQRLQTEVGHWDERVAVFEGQEAPRLRESLQESSFEDQIRRIKDESDLQSWGLCQLLLRQSLDMVFDQPLAAVQTAEVAAKLSSFLGDAYDPHWVLDLRARAHAYLGNARRVLGELRSAEMAFLQADGFLEQSMTGNEEVRAEVLHLKSSLRRQQRRLDEALALVEEALSIYREWGNHQGMSIALVKKAKIVEELGDLEQSIELLREAVSEIDPRVDVRLPAYARYNLTVCLSRAGEFDEAQGILQEIRPYFQQVARPLDLVRLRWTEGRIAAGRDDAQKAETAFHEVRAQFIERRMAYDAALVSLDLALILARQHRVAEIKELAKQLIPVFESQDVRREVLISLALFQQACEEERLTVDIVQQLSQLLEAESQRKVRQ
jgi:tetratricopeptide (TPR) repeat protein